MGEMTFATANMPIAVAAKALKMDAQTVRLLLQTGAVEWGIAYKRGNSRQYSYLIYPRKFYELTGYIYQPNIGGQGDERV